MVLIPLVFAVIVLCLGSADKYASRFFASPDVLGLVFARRDGAISPLLIGEEDGHDTDRYRNAHGHGESNVIAADEAVHKQGGACARQRCC